MLEERGSQSVWEACDNLPGAGAAAVVVSATATASVVSATMAACVVGAAVSSTSTGATVLKVSGNSAAAVNWRPLFYELK